MLDFSDMKVTAIFLFSLAFAAGGYAQHTERPENRDQWIREGDSTREARLEAFSDLKFGMFIHWGLYAQLGGEWKGKAIPPNRPYAEQINLTMRIPNAEYEQLARLFNPTAFDAKEWVRMAKGAGMQYMVFTAKHQEGFSMFDSPCTTYDIVDATPFGRDPVRELAEACKEAGLKFGLYYSNARDFHEAGANWNANGNTWDFPAQTEADFEAYFYGKVFCEVSALLRQYGEIELLWFDVPYKLNERMSRDLKELVTSIQPNCLVNSRIGNGYGDYISLGDNEIARQTLPATWETCMTINDTWGYSRHDHRWKTPETLIRQLAEVSSKGGNYLLNVGPMGNGRFPDTAKRTLEAIGRWMEGHRDAIVATRPSLVRQQSDRWVCTVRGDRLYVHVIDRSCTDITVELPKGGVRYVRDMASSTLLDYSDEDGMLAIKVSKADLTDRYVTVFEVGIMDRITN